MEVAVQVFNFRAHSCFCIKLIKTHKAWLKIHCIAGFWKMSEPYGWTPKPEKFIKAWRCIPLSRSMGEGVIDKGSWLLLKYISREDKVLLPALSFLCWKSEWRVAVVVMLLFSFPFPEKDLFSEKLRSHVRCAQDLRRPNSVDLRASLIQLLK